MEKGLRKVPTAKPLCFSPFRVFINLAGNTYWIVFRNSVLAVRIRWFNRILMFNEQPGIIAPNWNYITVILQPSRLCGWEYGPNNENRKSLWEVSGFSHGMDRYGILGDHWSHGIPSSTTFVLA